MNDDQFESHLRAGLHRRAADIDATIVPSAVVAGDARARTARRQHRRMATASIATVAAVAVGLVVIARDPATQSVRTKFPAGAQLPGLAAGAATGSSTGSATGSPTGWTTFGGATPADDSKLPRYTLWFDPSDPTAVTTVGSYAYGARRGTGLAAADLAVAADVSPDRPLRFVIASVQDSSRLSAGKGGTETAIAGRHARILSKRAATTILWDLSDSRRVLVVTAGVTVDELATWLGSLTQGSDGTWAFAPGTAAGGLSPIGTVTPTDQVTRTLSWDAVGTAADGTCVRSGASLSTTNGGAYELWARVADSVRWSQDLPTVVPVAVPGTTRTVLGFAASSFGDLLAADGDVVLDISRWSPSNGVESAGEVASSALAAMLTRPTDAEWSALMTQAANSDRRDNPNPGCIDEKELAAGGAPVATAPPTTAVSTTAVATTAGR